MTPAQLDALLRQHRRLNDPKGRGDSGPEQGSSADLLSFARMGRA